MVSRVILGVDDTIFEEPEADALLLHHPATQPSSSYLAEQHIVPHNQGQPPRNLTYQRGDHRSISLRIDDGHARRFSTTCSVGTSADEFQQTCAVEFEKYLKLHHRVHYE